MAKSNWFIKQQNALYLSVNVFYTKVLIRYTIFYVSYLRSWTSILRGHPSHAKVQPLAVPLGVPSFISHFKTLSNGPAPGIESATSRSAVKRFTDWANPAAVTCITIFCTFRCRCCTTTMWKCLISRFVEKGITWQRLSYLFLNFDTVL